jgi:hypothetical protein
MPVMEYLHSRKNVLKKRDWQVFPANLNLMPIYREYAACNVLTTDVSVSVAIIPRLAVNRL